MEPLIGMGRNQHGGGERQRASPGPVQLHPTLLRLLGRLHPDDLPLRTEAQNGIQPVPPGYVCEFLSVSFVKQVPRSERFARLDHAISLKSRDPERQPP